MADIELMSVFVLRELASSKTEAERLLSGAKKNVDYLGGRIIPPPQRTKRWLVDTYYQDVGGKPPTGMARLKVPMVDQALRAFGLPARRQLLKKAING